MNLLFRLVWLLLTVKFRSRLGILDDSMRRFIVWPNDLDLNLHMNNGRYLTVMDLGRFDLTFRTGLGRLLFQRRWRPVVGGVRITYRRSLDPFQRYELHTRLHAWDAKWVYLEQRFIRNGQVHAEAMVKAIFLGPAGSVPSDVVGAALGLPAESLNPVPDFS
ncbi:MAG: thioesterase family protein [Acidobacteria bacterium]|nr:thioesterase family protein [Acidobacteriota bacterium]